MKHEVDPGQQGNPTPPGADQQPTFEQLPPRDYQAAVDQARLEIARDFNMTVEDVIRYEEMADQEQG